MIYQCIFWNITNNLTVTIKTFKKMKKSILIIAGGIIVLASSCNNSTEPAAAAKDTVTTVVTDTVTKVVEVPATIDSAAITAEYLATENKTKKATSSKPTKQGDKEVNIYSEEPIPSHEAIEQAVVPPSPTKIVVVHDKEFVYFTPAEKAKFPGGEQAFNAYVKKSVKYPEDALKFHIEGTVFTDVYLDSLGNVAKVDFPGKHLGFGLEQETERIMTNCPRWMPARENGKTVKSKLTVPVTYKITK
jgi:Gram-negative bacterial TonB protein C-terminal